MPPPGAYGAPQYAQAPYPPQPQMPMAAPGSQPHMKPRPMTPSPGESTAPVTFAQPGTNKWVWIVVALLVLGGAVGAILAVAT